MQDQMDDQWQIRARGSGVILWLLITMFHQRPSKICGTSSKIGLQTEWYATHSDSSLQTVLTINLSRARIAFSNIKICSASMFYHVCQELTNQIGTTNAKAMGKQSKIWKSVGKSARRIRNADSIPSSRAPAFVGRGKIQGWVSPKTASGPGGCWIGWRTS